MVPMCFSRLDASTDMQHELLGSLRDLTWPWPEVKFWHWHVNANLCIFRCVSARETRWCPNYVSSFLSSKLICENHFAKKYFLILPTPIAEPVEVRSSLTTCQRKSSKEAIECFFPRPPICNSFWANGTFPKNYDIFAIFYLWWPLLTSHDDLTSKWPK